MLAGREQRRAVLGHAERVPLDPGEHGVRQHHVVAAEPGRRGEAEADPALGERDLEQVAAVDVELGAELVELGQHPLGGVDRQAGHLDLEAGIVLGRAADHDDEAAVGLGDQQQRELEAAERRAGAVRQVVEGGRGELHPVVIARHQLLERRHGVVRRQRQAAHLHRPAGAGRPRVQRGLQVDVLERGQLPGHHRMGGAVGAEEAADQGRDLAPFLAVGGVNPVEEGTELGGELSCIRLGRVVRHTARLTTRDGSQN